MMLQTTNKVNLEHNHLLAALPATARKRLLSGFKPIDMPLGRVIYQPGVKMQTIYFPLTNCIVSKFFVTSDGASAEIALVGNEGMVGVDLLMGDDITINRALVVSAGQALQIDGKLLKAVFDDSNELQHLLLRYTQALITQTAQAAVCNRHHSIDQQLCRRLLYSLDRLEGGEILMTQELIATMLGVRREGVTEAAQNLQASGLINYSRGHITVLNRTGLEARVCECYRAVKNEYNRLLPERNNQHTPQSGSNSGHAFGN